METMEQKATRIAMEIMAIHSRAGIDSIVTPAGIIEDLEDGMTEEEILNEEREILAKKE